MVRDEEGTSVDTGRGVEQRLERGTESLVCLHESVPKGVQDRGSSGGKDVDLV